MEKPFSEHQKNKFFEKNSFYKRKDEQLWDLINRIEEQKQKQEHLDQDNHQKEQNQAYKERLMVQIEEKESEKK